MRNSKNQPLDTVKKQKITYLQDEKTNNVNDIVSNVWKENAKSDIKSRKEYSIMLFKLICWQAIGIYAIVILKLFYERQISDELIKWLIVGTFGETIILVRFIVRYLFNNDVSTHFGNLIKQNKNENTYQPPAEK